MVSFLRKPCVLAILLIFSLNVTVQAQSTTQKYPSLLWEITGNGLKKPSYLFGTMHVSSKKVFHLSDSFFIALRNADVVALELNPDIWQEQMVKLDREKANYTRFYSDRNIRSGYINENTFRPEKDYLPAIKRALQESPMVINSLLYRSMEYRQDYEEDTFLDMYIYQTGKKLGKRASGVENYYEMDRLTMEAVVDRSKEKTKKKRPSFDYDDDVNGKSDEAYRKGDLDMLDSLQRLTETSEAFTEKFLYKRNEIQGNSMDTIMKKGKSLFVGVGAAHLPGERGVIEWLRKKGYRLRPIRMADRDAVQRDKIDKIRVPVSFRDYTTPDGMIKLRVPGEMYERDDIAANTGWQYADMSNGAYYMITRVSLPVAVTNISPSELFRKTDSMLYENIPGKILKKINIEKGGYKGLDVTTKTRRGDIQRYNFFFTPFELIIIKMSGNDDYVQGKEAMEFFRSITITPSANAPWVNFQPANGGFSVQLPHQPYERNELGGDWMWSADNNNEHYLLLKRTMFNNRELPSDTLTLALMEESYTGEEKNLKTLRRVFDVPAKGISSLNALYLTADTQYLAAKYIVTGPHHFLLMARGKNKKEVEDNRMFASFKITPFVYNASTTFTDSLLNFTVRTPMAPSITDTLKNLMHAFSNLRRYDNDEERYRFYSKDNNMVFTNDTTGEVILVNYAKLGKYYSVPDSVSRKKDSLMAYIPFFEYKDVLGRIKKKYQLVNHKMFTRDGVNIFQLAYTDTGSSVLYRSQLMLKDDNLFTISTVTSTTGYPGSVTDEFFNSFIPLNGLKGTPLYISKTDSFFADYNSTDTSVQKFARTAIESIRFERKDLPRMVAAMNSLNLKDKNYFELKSDWINAIGRLKDTAARAEKLQVLKQIYEKTADTSLFQTRVLRQLVNQETKESYAAFKDYLLQDPPVGGADYYSYEYSNDFFSSEDSLELLRTLFPEILQLTTLEDYKKDINSVLVKLVDSNRIAPQDYESYLNMILFDARITLKKQHNEDEKKTQAELEKDDTKENYSFSENQSSRLMQPLLDYATLLLPFYDKNPAVPRYIEKLWQTKDDLLKFNLMLQMITVKRPFPDTLVAYFAGKEEMRGMLYYHLAKLKKENLFPGQYKTQDQMAKAFLYTTIPWFEDEDNVKSGDYAPTDREDQRYFAHSNVNGERPKKKMDSIELIKKELITWKGKKGYIYFYKYRMDKEDKWKIALSGLQPEDGSISYINAFTETTGMKIKEDEPLADQLAKQLKQMMYEKNPATKNFFTGKENGYNNYRYDDD